MRPFPYQSPTTAQRVAAAVTRAAAFAAAFAVALAPAARARVIRAQTILPPGQSGFVSLTGLTAGTGSPHLYDQLQDFIDFRWKPAEFGRTGTPSSAPRAGVTIVRDGYVVPAATANN